MIGYVWLHTHQQRVGEGGLQDVTNNLSPLRYTVLEEACVPSWASKHRCMRRAEYSIYCSILRYYSNQTVPYNRRPDDLVHNLFSFCVCHLCSSPKSYPWSQQQGKVAEGAVAGDYKKDSKNQTPIYPVHQPKRKNIMGGAPR